MIDREVSGSKSIYNRNRLTKRMRFHLFPATPPFATVDGELITFGDLFHEVMVKSGRAEDKSYMDYDKDLGND